MAPPAAARVPETEPEHPNRELLDPTARIIGGSTIPSFKLPWIIFKLGLTTFQVASLAVAVTWLASGACA